jgi:FtsP/CotA-like multicopper oxidase with cupredoxin domain
MWASRYHTARLAHRPPEPSFVVRYDDRPGMWMFHCHILDHAEAGMMGTLMLLAPGQH